MDYEDIFHEVILDIARTEEGRRDLEDYARGKINSARVIFERYSELFQREARIRVDFSDRYFEENASILLEKQLPKDYEQWKHEGFDGKYDGRYCLGDSILGTLSRYFKTETFDDVRTGEIPEKMEKELDESGLNEFIANRIADRIHEAIETGRYYSMRALISEPSCESIAEELSYELRSLMQTIRPDELKEILDREQHRILNRVDRTIDNALDERKRQKAMEEQREADENEQSFQESIKFEGVDYSVINGEQGKEEQNQDKDKQGESIYTLPTDLLI